MLTAVLLKSIICKAKKSNANKIVGKNIILYYGRKQNIAPFSSANQNKNTLVDVHHELWFNFPKKMSQQGPKAELTAEQQGTNAGASLSSVVSQHGAPSL